MGYLNRPLAMYERVIFVILAVAALAPNQIATIVGFVGTIAATVIFSKAKRNKAAAA